MSEIKMKKGICVLLISLVIMSFATAPGKGRIVKLAEFNKFIDTVGLKFTMPAGYNETNVFENRDLYFAFAIKNKKEDYEIRYSIWSLKPDIESYKKCKLDSAHCGMLSPNVIYRGRIQANVLNMTGGREPNIGEFPENAVKAEFNANAGGSSFFLFNCIFGNGFKFGQMIYLHKDNVSDVIITYMSNDKEKHQKLMGDAFHALVYK